MGLKAFVFDLDMTLVDSSALESWRRSGHWAHVRSNLHLVRPFLFADVPPHSLPGRLRSLGYKVGIVTSSVRWYAEAVLKLFGVPYDALIAYEDTERHKPDPQPIEAALAALGVAANQGAYVGDAAIDIEASYHANVLSIGAAWGVANVDALGSAAPDVMLVEPDALLRVDELERRGYLAESAISGVVPVLHAGAMLSSGGTPARYALGRYFGREDPRHGTSKLSNVVLDFKSNDAAAPLLAQALAAGITLMGWQPEYLVAVPPKPGQVNRFARLLTETVARLPRGPQAVHDGLECVKVVTDYKTLGLFGRAQAIQGAFQTRYNWASRRLLLVDDVVTTGGTSNECARVLLAAGAAEVRIVAIARDQQVFARKLCPECQRPMRVRKNRSGEKFWGCSGYPDQCQNTENF